MPDNLNTRFSPTEEAVILLLSSFLFGAGDP